MAGRPDDDHRDRRIDRGDRLAETDLAPGDTLLLYSDGVTEAGATARAQALRIARWRSEAGAAVERRRRQRGGGGEAARQPGRAAKQLAGNMPIVTTIGLKPRSEITPGSGSRPKARRTRSASVPLTL